MTQRASWVKTQTMKGFTIVELLVVIVVIAILASITVVAYTGIQNQARHTALISTVDAWEKILQIAKAETGSYPATFTQISTAPYFVYHTKLSTMYTCLGPEGSYPAKDGFAEDACMIYSTDGGATYETIGSLPNAELTQKLSAYTSSLPKAPNMNTITSGVGTSVSPKQKTRGIFYASNETNGFAVLLYMYEGDYDCPRGTKSTGQDATTGVVLSSCSITLN